jgi:galactokinase
VDYGELMKRNDTLANFPDVSDIVTRLVEAGMPAETAKTKSSLFQSAAKTLLTAGVDPTLPTALFAVPGRIEVLGKHTDYAGGRSMIAATGHGFCLVVVGRQDTDVVILDSRTRQSSRFPITSDSAPVPGHWSNYARTVAQRIAMNFPGNLKGADIAFWSDLPPASGMSSSSAMLTGIFLALSAVNDLPSRDEYKRNITTNEQLAAYLSSIENGSSYGSLAGSSGVGTNGGSEDHTAILCSAPGILSIYSYCPVRLERRVEFPENHILAIASSGVIAEKTGTAMAKYNNASDLAGKAVKLWNEFSGEKRRHPADVVSTSGVDRVMEVLIKNGDESIRHRMEQFITESNEIVPAASDALESGDLTEFGAQVHLSQKLAEMKLGNQVEETVFLAESARNLGAVAASAFGAGFGGSVWAICRRDTADDFLDEWSERYRQRFPEPGTRSCFFTTTTGCPALRI